jgi:hypothetical protein
MTVSCPASWTLGSGKSLPATGSFSPNAVPRPSSNDVTTFISKTAWSLGYSDSGNGIGAGLLEVTLKNKNGVWLTSQTANVSAAASKVC